VFLVFGHEESVKQKKIRMKGGEATVTVNSNFSWRHGQRKQFPWGKESFSLLFLSQGCTHSPQKLFLF
jgi:hypothetical protein